MSTVKGKSLEFLPHPLGSVSYGVSKKVTVTSGASLQICTASEAQMGYVVRVISTDGQVSFGGSDLTNDSGAAPGAHALQSASQGLVINMTGAVYAITSAGSASLAITALDLP